MSIQIASLFASIGADTSGLDRGLQHTKSGLNGVGEGFKGMSVGINQALELAAKAAQAVGAAYAVIKDAAALDLAANKFDRLSASIGTTSTALLRDLRASTRGLMSDSELMASASDFMALGFAKSGEEVARLTNLAGALGMNMNQLVLTLANQTTMRFDQLGVSVDGFDAKVKKLEATGMSASDAFQEAFMLQAEEQIEKVGHVADTTAGSLQALEAKVKNFGDSVKAGFLTAFTGAEDEISAMIDSIDLMRVDEDDFLGIASATKESVKNITNLGLSFALLTSAISNPNISPDAMMGYIASAFGFSADSVQDSTYQMQADLSELNGTMDTFGMMIFNQTNDWKEYADIMRSVDFTPLSENIYNIAKGFQGVNEVLPETNSYMLDTVEKIATSNGAYEDLYWKLFDVSTSYDQFKSLIAESGIVFGHLTEDGYAAGKAIEFMATSSESAVGRVNGTSYEAARGELGSTTTAVGLLAQAYRDLDTATLGIQGELIQSVVLELETKWKSGVISEPQFLTALGNLDATTGTSYKMKYELELGMKEGASELAMTLLTEPEKFAEEIITITTDLSKFDEEFVDAQKKVQAVVDALALIKRNYWATVHIAVVNTTGTGGYGPTQGTDTGGNFNPRYPAVGGPVYTNSPYIVGERGPELFVPSGSGYILTNAQTANAMDGNGNGSLSEIVSRIPTARDIAVAVRDALLLAG